MNNEIKLLIKRLTVIILTMSMLLSIVEPCTVFAEDENDYSIELLQYEDTYYVGFNDYICVATGTTIRVKYINNNNEEEQEEIQIGEINKYSDYDMKYTFGDTYYFDEENELNKKSLGYVDVFYKNDNVYADFYLYDKDYKDIKLFSKKLYEPKYLTVDEMPTISLNEQKTIADSEHIALVEKYYRVKYSGNYDAYTLIAKEGDEDDTILSLYDDSGNLLLDDDDGGDGYYSSISFEKTDEERIIGVKAYGGALTNTSLKMVKGPESVKSVVFEGDDCLKIRYKGFNDDICIASGSTIRVNYDNNTSEIIDFSCASKEYVNDIDSHWNLKGGLFSLFFSSDISDVWVKIKRFNETIYNEKLFSYIIKELDEMPIINVGTNVVKMGEFYSIPACEKDMNWYIKSASKAKRWSYNITEYDSSGEVISRHVLRTNYGVNEELVLNVEAGKSSIISIDSRYSDQAEIRVGTDDSIKIKYESEFGYINGQKYNTESVERQSPGKIEFSDVSCSDIDGYRFIGWRVKGTSNPVYVLNDWNKKVGQKLLSEYEVTNDVTFEAVWKEAYKITFVSNEGYLYGDRDMQDDFCYIDKGSNIFYYGIPSGMRDGYMLEGWQDEESKVIYSADELTNIKPSNNMIFTAVWTEAFKVTLNGNGVPMNYFYDNEGQKIGQDEEYFYVKKGENISQKNIYPSRLTYNDLEFAGWSIKGDNTVYVWDVDIDEDNKYLSNYKPESDVTFYAVWRAPKQEIDRPVSDGNLTDDGNVLNIYCWNYEFPERLAKFYPGFKAFDNNDITKGGTIGDIKVNFIIIATGDNLYQTKLCKRLRNNEKATGNNKIDIFMVEAGYSKDIINTLYAAKLSDLGISESELSNQYSYTHDCVSDNDGNIRGASWQVCPSAMIYNVDIAQRVFGTNDPEKVQSLFSDWNKYEKASELIGKAGYKMTATANDTFGIFDSNTSSPYISDGKYQIDDNLKMWAEISKKEVDNGLTSADELWSSTWMDGFANDSNVFCYFGPTWLIDFSMGNKNDGINSDDGSRAFQGGWRVCEGPQNSYWGGTWICGANGSDNSSLVADIIRKLTIDPDIMTSIMRDTGDYVNNKTVMKSFAYDSSFNNLSLGGQNPVRVMDKCAERIHRKALIGGEDDFNRLFISTMNKYFRGEIETYDKAVSELMSKLGQDIDDPVPSLTPASTPTSEPTPLASPIPESTPLKVPTGSPTIPPEATSTGIPKATPTKTPTCNPVKVPDDKPSIGSEWVISSGVYSVTSENTVKFVSPKNKNVKSVSIPSTIKIKGETYKVTEVKTKAFANYKKLKKVTIGKNVTIVGTKAFNGCKKLKTIKVKSTEIKKIGKKAFVGVPKSAKAKVPKKCWKSYKKLFKKGSFRGKVKK